MSDSLNVQMARALGWTNIHVEDGVLVGYSQTERENGQIPDYAGSLDACAAALPVHLNIDIYPIFDADWNFMDAFNARLEDDRDADTQSRGTHDVAVNYWRGQGATRAEALARALLAWATAKRGTVSLAEKGNADER